MAASSAVVGRAREQRTIESFLDADRSGARVLLLVGEAGIGKTTLWRAAVSAARARGISVLSSSGSMAETRLAFAAIADLLEAHVDDVLPALPPPQAHALAVALLRIEAEGAPPDPAKIAFAVLAGLRELAVAAPVLVAVDDVQWLDEPSAASLAFALRRLGDDDVWFVIAQRTTGESALPLGLDRHPQERVARVEIGPLSLGAVSAVVTDRLGTALPRPALRRVHETAGGNPFYALELARAILRAGGRVAPGEPMPVPTRLEELLAARLVVLPDMTRAALLHVAALREPTVELVGAALGIGDPRAMLEPAVEAHVIDVDRDRVRFAHPLLTAAVYARADAEERRDTHRALADVAPTVEERARHLALASEPPDETVAQVLDHAGQGAIARGSPASAAELSELAVRFTGREHAGEQLRRRCDAAEYHVFAGDGRRASAVAASLVEDAPAGVQRARALFVLSFVDARAEADVTKRIARLERALVEAAGADELAARINNFLFILALVALSVQQARAYAERGLALAETSATRAQSAALVILADLLAGRQPDDELFGAALELEGASGVLLQYGPRVVRALRYTFDDRADEARAAFDAASLWAAEHGDEVTLALLLFHRAELECRAGNFALAAEHARDAYAICQQIGAPDRIAIVAYVQALAHGFLGDVEVTRAKAAETSARPAFWQIRAHAVLGLLELSLGDAAAAAAELRPLPDRLVAMGFCEPWHLDAVPPAIEALAELGDLGEAERLLGLYAQRVAGGPFGRAAAARSRGIVAAARGEHDRAFDAFAQALREHDAIETPFERARTMLALGRAQRRARQRGAARESLEAARASFEQLGARLWAERAREELGRIGGRQAATGDLTPSERRIAQLVAEGKTNKEVAAVLVVADRTVESALTHIYRKLSVRSRTELARKLTSGG